MRRLSPARRRPGRNSHRVPILALLALWIGAASGARAAHAGETLRYDLRAEVGGEYDSNAHRTEIIDGIANAPIVGSPLARAALSGHLADVVADRPATRAVGDAGRQAVHGAGGARRGRRARLDQRALADRGRRRRPASALQAIYYEAFQRASTDPADAADRRDFRSLTPTLLVDRRLSGNAVLVGAAGLSIVRVQVGSRLRFSRSGRHRRICAGRASRPTAAATGS